MSNAPTEPPAEPSPSAAKIILTLFGVAALLCVVLIVIFVAIWENLMPKPLPSRAAPSSSQTEPVR